jgi:phosphoenolpyruvate carboxylase
MLSSSLTTAVQCHLTVFRLTSSTSSQANKEEIYDALLLQKVDIVLTAHPTEVNRRTLLRKYKEISESLAKLDKKDLSPYEKSECEEALRREIYSIWGSDEIRREKPTPQTEAKGVDGDSYPYLLSSAAQRA